jgi:ABC-type multidrug transport system fused ATPase/permease subunit
LGYTSCCMRNINYSVRDYLSDLWHYIRPHRSKFYTALFFRITCDIARLYPAYAIAQIVQILTQNNITAQTNKITNIFIIWGLVTAYYSFFHNFSRYLGFQVAENASLELYKRTLNHIFKLDYSWQEKENSGNKMKRIDKGLEGVNTSIRKIFNPIVEVLVNLIGVILIFLGLDKLLSLSLVIYVLVFFMIGSKMLKKAITQEKIVNKTFEDLTGITFESLNNIQTIKSLSIEKGVGVLIKRHITQLVPRIKKRIYYYQTLWGITNSWENFFKYSIILYLSFGVIHNTSSIGILVLFIQLFEKVDNSVADLVDVTQEIAVAKIGMSRAAYILAINPKIEDEKSGHKKLLYPPDWNEIKVKDINFSYNKNKAISNVSFNIKRGEKVGIVGLSGAGKSTLFKLFLDLYENYKGNIFLDNIPLKSMQRSSYINHVAVVLQDTELFDMSLRDNIEIAAVSKIKDVSVLDQVIDRAHLREVVDDLPKGVDTLVGEKGIKLSGGQRQRVGIARALFRKPDILLMDEATSHLDTHSEKEIQRAILETVDRFTAIVIAHRLSTIKAMDKIIVLDKGQLAEQGSFDELLRMDGLFAKMWYEQKI